MSLLAPRHQQSPAPLARVALLLATVSTVVLGTLATTLAAQPPDEPSATEAPVTAGLPTPLVRVKLLAINDLHGGLANSQEINGRPVGGAAHLAAHLKARAATSAHTFTVGVGDMFGASAAVSGLLHEEPTVRTMNAMQFLLNAPGNHELDQGVEEFLRLTHGGCRTDGGCFEGARFRQISANIIVAATGAPLLPPYHLEDVEGTTVAFIGVTHTHVRSLTRPGAVDGLVFVDPAEAVNVHVRALQAQGVHAFVVLIHEGGWIDSSSERLAGPIAAIVDAMDPDVDVVLSSHTHQRYVTRHAGKLVTQGWADGLAFVEVDLVIDRASRDIREATAVVITNYADEFTPYAEVLSIVGAAEAQIKPRIERRMGTARRELTNLEMSAAGETPLGNLIADAQRWATNADIALVNLFSVRSSIPAGAVTWGDLYTAQAYGNELVTMSLSGDQLYRLLEQQWTGDGDDEYRPIQVSGLRVESRPGGRRGSRIIRLTLANGEAVRLDRRYTVVTNAFLADGGDGCIVLTEGNDRAVQMRDFDALAAYVEQLPNPFDAAIEGRLIRRD